MAASNVVDLFAGPGGIDLALHAHGFDPLGIEWDDAACLTREAAGLRTLQADVSELDPLDFAPCEGMCGGPPCPAFSMAGKGEGRDAMPFYVEAIERMGRGEQIDRAEMDEACGDERAHLVLEPLRWALALSPRWIVLEQVPPVLPLWEATAMVLRANGYATWTGILSAEQYGVPQTRKRAFLIASLDRPVSAPPATHARYVAPRRGNHPAPAPAIIVGCGNGQLAGGSNSRKARQARADYVEPQDTLFAAPEPERIVLPEDRHLLPWVSMAEALGWSAPIEQHFTRGEGMTERHGERPGRAVDEPSFTILAGSQGSGTRLQWKLRAGTNANDASRAADEPAPTIRFGARLNDVSWVLRTGNFTAQDFRGQRGVPYERAATEPAPTIRAAGAGEWVAADVDEPSPCGCPWEYIDADGFCACCHAHIDDPAGLYAEQGDGTHTHCAASHPTHYDRRQSERAGVVLRPTGDPAPTRCASKLAKGVDVWTTERPATTVNGDPRVAEPGRHDPAQPGSQYGAATVRVTIEEAAALQSFPPGYPWQGTKTKRFEQVGNAVPPLLAWHVLRAVVAPSARLESEAA